MGQRYSAVIEMVQAGDDWDEWFRIRTSLTIDDIDSIKDIDSDVAKANVLAGRLITEWSLPYPVSVEGFRELPYAMVMPVIQAAGDFLVARSKRHVSQMTISSDLPQITTA